MGKRSQCYNFNGISCHCNTSSALHDPLVCSLPRLHMFMTQLQLQCVGPARLARTVRMSSCSRHKASLARVMRLRTVALSLGQTCGRMQHVEQELLELGTCCTCTVGMCTSTAGVVTVSTMLRPCLLHAAQTMSSDCSNLQSASAVALDMMSFEGIP